MKNYAYLSQNEDGTWTVEDHHGFPAQGSTREGALEELKKAVREFAKSESYKQPSKDAYRWLIEEVEALTLDDCLSISKRAFEHAVTERIKVSDNHKSACAGSESVLISSVEPFPSGGFFSRHRLLRVFSPGDALETATLPNGGSFGFFAFDGKTLRCLNRNARELEKVFRIEGRSIRDGDPDALAKVIGESLGRRGNAGHHLIRLDDLEQMETGGWLHYGGRYCVDTAEFDRIKDRMHTAKIENSEAEGWVVRFSTLSGWMHNLQRVIVWRLRFWPNFEFTCEQDVLTERFFAEVPNFSY